MQDPTAHHRRPTSPAQAPPPDVKTLDAEPVKRLYRTEVSHNGSPEMKPVIGTVSSGRVILLQTNTVKAILSGTPKIPWYRHQVTIFPLRVRSSTAPLPPKSPPKAILREVWSFVEEAERNGYTNHFGGVVGVFDGKATCYTSQAFSQDELNFEVEVPTRGRFAISIFNSSLIENEELRKMCSNEDYNFGCASEALAAVNTVLTHGLAALYPSAKNKFYVSHGATVGLDVLPGAQNRHNRRPLTGGLDLWRGVFLSMRPAYQGLFLTVNTTTGVFIREGGLPSFICSARGLPFNPQHAAARNIPPGERVRINRLLRGCTVSVNMGPTSPPLRNMKVHRAQGGITSESVAEAYFEIAGSGGKKVSVEQYFLNHHGIRLADRNLPCLKLKEGRLYPIELVSIQPGTPFNGRLNTAQQNEATDFQTLRPTERLDAIRRLVDLNSPSSIPCVAQPYFDAFGVELAPHAELTKIPGRILSPPRIEYSGARHSDVDRGAWKMTKNQHRFTEPARLGSFALIVNDQRDAKPAADCLMRLFDAARGLGMKIKPIRMQDIERVVVVSHPTLDVPMLFAKARESAMASFGASPELVFWVFNKTFDENYAPFKQEGLRLGIATQALQKSKVFSKGTDFQFQINVAMKINVKLGGQNFRHAVGTSAGIPRSMPGLVEQYATMTFGCDLTHIDGQPSIAGIVASMDRENLVYEEAITVQALKEPPPGNPDARPKKEESIVNMRSMIRNLLVRFHETVGAHPPEHLAFLRDGAGESEWSAIIDREVRDIRLAIEDYRERFQCFMWQPKLTYIVVVKRHHVRAFVSDPKDAEGKAGNIPAGTVFDGEIGHPSYFEWYGASHTGILGTTRPARYVVLKDDLNLRATPDVLQAFTNALCHSYERCNRAVSIPAPVYYADLLCQKVRSWMPGHSSGSDAGTGSSSPDTPASRSAALMTCQNVLTDMRHGRMAFRGSHSRRAAMWWL